MVFNYASFRPGNLESGFTGLKKDYADSTKELQDLFMSTVLPGTTSITPDLLGAKDIISDAAVGALPASRSIISYAESAISVIPIIDDRKDLTATLKVSVDQWKYIDVNRLDQQKEEYADKFQTYLPKLNSVIKDLYNFNNDLLASVGSKDPPEFYSQTLFDILRMKLEKVARIPDGIPGQSAVSTLLKVKLDTVDRPLSQVFAKPLPWPIGGPPIKPEDIAKTIAENVINRLESYRTQLLEASRAFATFAKVLNDIASAQEDVKTRLTSTAGEEGDRVTKEQAIKAWTAVQKAAEAYIKVVST